MSNNLISEKSPYLISHANNPVNWYPWGDIAFEKAKEQDLPIFLSIGYSTCHWCHVMERESFCDQQVADILNKNFISIKVDREELSDVDHYYMECCQAMTGAGGWPLSLFLDHNKQPFFAGTYFPKDDGKYHNTIGFISLLNKIIDIWQHSREKIMISTQSVHQFMAKGDGNKLVDEHNFIGYDKIFNGIERMSDKVNGGISGAPKFPMAPMLMFLLQYHVLKDQPKTQELLNLFLTKMAQGGIYDHIGGGFFRYSTDEKWLIPHFEKMVYDNALLLYIYAIASKEIDKKFYKVAEQIADYLIRDMYKGAFFTAEDADTQGIEGLFYLFTPDEIIDILGKEDGILFCKEYGITQKGNFENKNIPNQINKPFNFENPLIKKVFDARKKRSAPFKDDKILSASNGLAIAAFAVAGRLMEKPQWIKIARDTAHFMLSNLFDGTRLMARFRENHLAFKATLDDYGCFLWGLIELYNSTHEFKWLSIAIELSAQIIDLFYDGKGGMYLSGKDTDELPIRLKKYYDGAVPSGNALVAHTFIDLYQHTKDEKYKICYENILKGSTDAIDTSPFGTFALISAKMRKEHHSHIGLTTGTGWQKFIYSNTKYHPFSVITLYDDNYKKRFPQLYIDDNNDDAKALICNNKGCQPPIFNVNQYIDTLL